MRRSVLLAVSATGYNCVVKPILFSIPPEIVHDKVTTLGESVGNSSLLKDVLNTVFSTGYSILHQEVAGITFRNPIGLAAGFDYNARLTQVLPSLGFGFASVGTITNLSYQGNPSPILGRLPQSQSLMVNKGFKNKGALAIASNLQRKSFQIPIGISIGRTNSLILKTHKESIADILQAFHIVERKKVQNAYYELNISCPNLLGDISFYPVQYLRQLLREVDSLNLKKPLFIKMPINEDNKSVLHMLDVITEHNIDGVIIGNLQKNRNDEMLVKDEVRQFSKGYFSGKPTQKRSDELVALAYKHFHKRLIIIGCGGIFSAEDAYRKMRLGATLVQLITGLVYQGPQLVAQINNQLPKLLRRDGFTSLEEAIGRGY